MCELYTTHNCRSVIENAEVFKFGSVVTKNLTICEKVPSVVGSIGRSVMYRIKDDNRIAISQSARNMF
jgi:hypothetical protein